MRLFLLIPPAAIFFLCALAIPNPSAAADDVGWAQFRGPTGEGRTNVKLPTELANKKNHVWSTSTIGVGWSSPVVLNGQVWFTSAVTKEATPEQIAAKLAGVQFAQIKTMAQSVEFHAICLDLSTGKLIYDKIPATDGNPAPNCFLQCFEMDELKDLHQRLQCRLPLIQLLGKRLSDSELSEMAGYANSLDETHRVLLDQLKVDGFFTDYPDLGRAAVHLHVHR